MDDVTPKFNRHKSLSSDRHDPNVVEFVKLMARISARQDYTEFLKKIQEIEGKPQ